MTFTVILLCSLHETKYDDSLSSTSTCSCLLKGKHIWYQYVIKGLPTSKKRLYLNYIMDKNLSCFLHLPNKHFHGNTSSLNYFNIKFLPNFNIVIGWDREDSIALHHYTLHFFIFYIQCTVFPSKAKYFYFSANFQAEIFLTWIILD